MLDRHNPNQFHYYQPGIGTNTSSIRVSDDYHVGLVKKWYLKAKDAAFGSTFDEHVMAGYRYLIRFYSPGDRIYIFGFSRGAYVARILAEMLDHVGLLEAGNEGKVHYIWSVFSRWGRDREMDRKEKEETYRYMKALRETFCRPVSQIQFMGLFDTVNSIPRFEIYRNRASIPFTTKTTAKVIRHAVSIDEHRAKFRDDLLSHGPPNAESRPSESHGHQGNQSLESGPRNRSTEAQSNSETRAEYAFYRPAPRSYPQAVNPINALTDSNSRNKTSMHGSTADLATPENASKFTDGNKIIPNSLISPEAPPDTINNPPKQREDIGQDIEEVWFPGCHADIGGGLKLEGGESWALSHVPLVWMVHEAQRAGLQFDDDKLKQFRCFDHAFAGRSIADGDSHFDAHKIGKNSGMDDEVTNERSQFECALWKASTNGQMHDCLRYNHGTAWPSVLSWKLVEYLPFRRMSLRKDGSWKSIRWPLPLGETRDIPKDAVIHGSAFRRMEADPNYRPKNLVAKQKAKYSIDHISGGWEVHSHHGCPILATYRRSQLNGDRQMNGLTTHPLFD